MLRGLVNKSCGRHFLCTAGLARMTTRTSALIKSATAGSLQQTRSSIVTSWSLLKPLVLQSPSGLQHKTSWGGVPCSLRGVMCFVRTLKSAGGHRKGSARAQPTRIPYKKKLRKKIKLKTHGGAKKRFMQRGDGTWKHKAIGKQHLMAGTSRRRQTLRKRKKVIITNKGLIARLHRLMPYARRRRLTHRPVDYREKPLASPRRLPLVSTGNQDKPRANEMGS